MVGLGRQTRMNIPWLKAHLIDFEIISALIIGALLRFGFGTSWLIAILCGLSAFVVIPLLVLLVFHARAQIMARRFHR
jgi:hypothetical protein